MEDLRIEYLPIDSLKPYENNARVHKDEDVNAIKASIEEFGFDDPVGIWSDDNIIVEGHGRLLAAKQLGMKTVPVIRLDHLTDEQRRAYALAHNRTAELSGWDFAIRDEELAQICEIDMSAFGFDMNDLENAIDEERKESAFNDNLSVVVECQTEQEAEDLFERLNDEGYKCRLSTL